MLRGGSDKILYSHLLFCEVKLNNVTKRKSKKICAGINQVGFYLCPACCHYAAIKICWKLNWYIVESAHELDKSSAPQINNFIVFLKLRRAVATWGWAKLSCYNHYVEHNDLHLVAV